MPINDCFFIEKLQNRIVHGALPQTTLPPNRLRDGFGFRPQDLAIIPLRITDYRYWLRIYCSAVAVATLNKTKGEAGGHMR